MGKIAKQIDLAEANVDLPDLPDRPPGMHWTRYNRLADRFEHPNNVWNITMMRGLVC